MLDFLSYNFIINALIISVLCSISSALIGSWIVIKRKVLISGGITHASFGGLGLAYFLGINPLIGGAFFAIATALGIDMLSYKKKIREDSAIGMFWSVGMAIGIIFMYLSPGYAPDLMSYLFGNILTTTYSDIIATGILSAILLFWFIFEYKKILYISFDEEFALSQHVNVRFHNMVLMLMTALTIVLNIKIAGIVLVISMLCIGQSAANLITHNLKGIIILSFLYNVTACTGGIIFSWWINIPSGASIIIVLTLIYIIVALCRRKINNN